MEGAPVPLAPLSAATAVSVFGDLAAWSAYEPATKLWRVALRRGDHTTILSAPAERSKIEVDVGPGPSGAPVLAYSACPGSCDVVVSQVDGSRPRAVPGSSGASHPVVWDDRVAWVRGADQVMSSLISGRGRVRIGGAPRRKCYEDLTTPRLACAAPKQPAIEGLALSGVRLALIDTFRLEDGVGSSGTTTEVRTEPVTGGPQRLIAIITVGEGDESWVGPSWLGGDLYFYEDSPGGDFEQVGTYRYDPATGSYAYAHGGGYLTGFAMTDTGHALEAAAPGDPRGGITCNGSGERYEGGSCAVQLSSALRFRPVKRHTLLFTP
jgi:hypothetical protein